MGSRTLGSLVLLLGLVGCGGTPNTDGDAGVDAGGVDCTSASDGTSCGSDRICLDGACVESRCGDGYPDSARGEECDDGNDVAFDGCDPGSCTLTCHEDAQCDDQNRCNGTETCGANHYCETDGAVLSEGDLCSSDTIPDGVCRAGDPLECVPANVCGNAVVENDESCDDGNTDDTDGCTQECAFTCTTDAECGDDGDACNGVERCDQITHVCTTDTPPMPSWYIDCDGDGFAHDTGGSRESCTQPTDPTGCSNSNGQWVALRPAGSTSTDCYDENVHVHPGQTEFFTTSSGAPERPFDYDCDGTEEKRYTNGDVSGDSSCLPICSGTPPTCRCSPDVGWTGAVPGCGVPADFSECSRGCSRSVETQTQGCR